MVNVKIELNADDTRAKECTEEQHHVCKAGLDKLENSANRLETLSLSTAQPTPSPIEQQQSIFEANRSEIRYVSEEVYENSEIEAIPIEAHKIVPDEIQNAAQKSLAHSAETNIAPKSVPDTLRGGRDLNRVIKKQGETRKAALIQLPASPGDIPLPAVDDCDLAQEDVSKKPEICSESGEIISQKWPQSDLDDIEGEGDSAKQLEWAFQLDDDLGMTDFQDPKFHEKSDEMNIDAQTDCEMPDAPDWDQYWDSERGACGDAIDTVIHDVQDAKQNIEMATCIRKPEDLVIKPKGLVMETPVVVDQSAQKVTIAGTPDGQPLDHSAPQQMSQMDLRHSEQATRTTNAEKQTLTKFPEQPAPVTIHHDNATIHSEKQFNNTVPVYQVDQNPGDELDFKLSLEELLVQIGDESGKCVHGLGAKFHDGQTEPPEHMETTRKSSKEAKENDMAQVHPPQNPSMALSQDSHTQPTGAETVVIGNIDTAGRDDKILDFKNGKKTLTTIGGEQEALSAVRNPEARKSRKPSPIFDWTIINSLLPPTLQETGLDQVNEKTSFNFEKIQRQEDELVRKGLKSAYRADSRIRNVPNALKQNKRKGNIILRRRKDVADDLVSNDEVVKAGSSDNVSDRSNYPSTSHGHDIQEKDDGSKARKQRRNFKKSTAESDDELALFAPRPSDLELRDKPGQRPGPFSGEASDSSSSDSSSARKSTPEQEIPERSVRTPKEHVVVSSSQENVKPIGPKDRDSVSPVAVDCPVTPIENTSRPAALQSSTKTPEPEQDESTQPKSEGVILPSGNSMHNGSPSQSIADLNTWSQTARSPVALGTKGLQRKKAPRKSKSRPPRIFHEKIRRAPPSPHGTPSRGSTERDEQLRPHERMANLNRPCSTSTQTTKWGENTNERKTTQIIPIKELRARLRAKKESEETAADDT
ncbi:uncharacterized protein MAM_05273 [Metarhizium album ARSEF 1941]|uniref:Uncharacterized protein n=1 Tax=Metarhizium album (strain ARSEF 1941) TaxID=1081103 RepID=A0A0B2WT90_METAS|nr:uncharacterized protein MAM_05273 [Metarhizium album ARSEF 1941]KHN96717.1 hypothetical protein MAM_05273 [Metarhizium album ARSEF 1941]